jgi:nucleotide-binding universal stress UspA family protein
MKLLIAVDSGISTEVLVDAVGVRPWPAGTTARVLSVVADTDVPPEVWREHGHGKAAVRKEMENRGEQITPPAVRRLKDVGISAEVVVTRGDARHRIPFFARKWSSDLIFVRAQVRKDFAHRMLGSVARAVVTTAPCTVQVVRDAAEDHALTLHGARRVLLGSDGSEYSVAAAEALAGRPWPEGSEFRIVTAEEPWLIRPTSGISNIHSAEEVLASAGLKPTAAVLAGNPKEVILEEAKKWNAHLIVVGSHGRRGFKRFLLGSVSEAVAMNAHCSVVVVRASPSARKK